MPILLGEERQYQRYIHTKGEQRYLDSVGLEPVASSNVSAIGTSGRDLVIRFHGGATYSYANQAKNYERMMAAASKGKWVWRYLIRPKVPYRKGADIEIINDIPSRDMMEGTTKPLGDTIASTLALSTMLRIDDAKSLGIIAGLLLASSINGNTPN